MQYRGGVFIENWIKWERTQIRTSLGRSTRYRDIWSSAKNKEDT